MESEIQRTINRYPSLMSRGIPKMYYRDEDGINRGRIKCYDNEVQVALERFDNGPPLRPPHTIYRTQKECPEEYSEEESDEEMQDSNVDDFETLNETLDVNTLKTNKDEQRGSNLVNFFFQLYKGQQLCDFTIKFDGNETGIHSLVLVEHSDKYYNLLCCQNSPIKSVTLYKSTSQQSVESVLDYLYTGEIDLTGESVDSILSCAKELDMQRLVIKCEEFKRRENESPNHRFRGGGKKKSISNIKITLKNEYSDVLDLDVDSFCRIISDDSILAENEIEVFNMAVAWLNYKTPRQFCAKQVLSCIRFTLMTPKEIATQVETQQQFFHSPEIKGFLYQAYKYHALNQSKSNSTLVRNIKQRTRDYFTATKKVSTQSKTALPSAWNPKKSIAPQRQQAGGDSERRMSDNCCGSKGCLHSTLCPANKNTMPTTSYGREFSACSEGKRYGDIAMPFAHNISSLKPSLAKVINNIIPKVPPMSIVGIQQDIFVFGGTDLQCSDTDFPGRQVLRLSKSIEAKKWEPISTLMPVARTNHCAVCIGAIVYIIGGAVPIKESEDNFAQPTNTTIAFDSESCEWIACSSMNHSRIYFTAATWKGRIFVFGGQSTGNSVLNSVESFDPAFDKWTKRCALPSGRVGCCAHEFQDKIFIIGGYAWLSGKPTALNDTYTYNPVNDCYYQLTKLARGLCYASLITTADNMWMFGGAESGCHDTQPLISIPHIRLYDVHNDKWKDVSFLNVPRHDCSTVAAGTRIFILGGLTVCNRPLSSVECFDTVENSLAANLPDLPCPSAGTRACIVSPYSNVYHNYQ